MKSFYFLLRHRNSRPVWRKDKKLIDFTRWYNSCDLETREFNYDLYTFLDIRPSEDEIRNAWEKEYELYRRSMSNLEVIKGRGNKETVEKARLFGGSILE